MKALLLALCLPLCAEENFVCIAKDVVHQIGPGTELAVTPCSTFKVTLSLIGFDSGILKSAQEPIWLFQEGYDDFLEIWKTEQTPQSWLKYSCVWFSNVLVQQLGWETLNHYVSSLDYGNGDLAGGLQNVWINSSLLISPKEQALFLWKMVHEELPISHFAVEMTKQLLFVEELANGWKLYGKTGWTGSKPEIQTGWFVGWAEKDEQMLSFAYNIRDHAINLAERIPRAKELLSTYLEEK